MLYNGIQSYSYHYQKMEIIPFLGKKRPGVSRELNLNHHYALLKIDSAELNGHYTRSLMYCALNSLPIILQIGPNPIS